MSEKPRTLLQRLTRLAQPVTSRITARELEATRTRWSLAAVAAGALVAAAVTVYFTGFRHTVQTHSPGSSPATAVAGAAFGSAVSGDCLNWNKPDASDLSKVVCSSRHLFEVVADIDLNAYPGVEFGPGAKFPDVLRFAELKNELCVPAANRYLDGTYDPHGKFTVGLINPGEAGWQAGERTVRCGLQNSVASGALRPVTGSVAGQDQSKVLEPGTCIGINQNLPTDPVDCAQPHAFEVVAILDLSSQFAAPPTDADQDKFMAARCQKATAEYLGAPDALRNKTLTLFWDHIGPESWFGGDRKLNCMIGKGGDNDGFAPLTGPAKGRLLINGQAPIPPPPVPDRRSGMR